MRSRIVALATVGVATAALFIAPTAAEATTAPKPTVSKVSPAVSPANGGITITITGKNFTKGVKVKFGTTAGKSVKLVSKTKLTVVVPKHSAGTVDVHVITKTGTSKSAHADKFTYRKPLATIAATWSSTTDQPSKVTFQLPGTVPAPQTQTIPLAGGKSYEIRSYTGGVNDDLGAEVDVLTQSDGGPLTLGVIDQVTKNFAAVLANGGARKVQYSDITPVTVAGATEAGDAFVSYKDATGLEYVWVVRVIDTATSRVIVRTLADEYVSENAILAFNKQLTDSVQMPPVV
jgi:hypothetical protein